VESIKVFEKTFPRGVGPSSDWKLEVEYLARDGEVLPALGISLYSFAHYFGSQEPETHI
jgi:hypothetical protein